MTRAPHPRPQHQRVPTTPRRVSPTGGITPGQVADARKDLGRHLAFWRVAAGLRQVDLATLIRYSRSQIANVEVGRDNTTRRFWLNADTTLGAHGALLAVYDQVHALMRDFHAQTELERDLERQLPTTQPAPFTPAGTTSPAS
ncbi:helix-turn-helix protein [Micromonospora sp. Llam0]|uniref:helix-turn-helix domain-containing protein n=1 Tax=Micromonospora sp. Llam0 TaxID=2485143 RepID=UPI000FB49540|nr:helix-turn-helix transcriptional regulator [Micromonospora sp. Llam0]ROO51801.1 helix-turn-helix protein [Micromonospora sp. Llam0]